ncbi:unnamed protein product, partial [Cuscuta epithymum]
MNYINYALILYTYCDLLKHLAESSPEDSLPGKITAVKKPSRHVISSTRSTSISFSGDCCNELDSDCKSLCSSKASCSHPPDSRPDEDDDTGKKDVPMWMIVPKPATNFVLVRIRISFLVVIKILNSYS